MKFIKLCDPVAEGGCSQHGPTCPSPGKAPLVANWPSTGQDERPEGNAGVVTGPPPFGSGVLVIDVDTPEGAAIFASWQLPNTYTVKSGRASGVGRHYYFQFPDGLLRVPARLGGPAGPELKGAGRQVVAAGSRHHSGGTYHVERDLAIAALPATFVEQVVASVSQTSAGPVVDATPEGVAALERILEHFPDAEEQADGNWNACCPAHADNSPSLVLTASGDRVLLFCRAGCPTTSVMQALGLDMRYLYAPQIGKKSDQGAPASPTSAGNNRTDAGNALRLVDLYGHGLRYVDPWKAWLCWDGKRWVRDRFGAALEAAKAVASSIRDEAANETDSKEAEALIKWAFASEARNKLQSMVDLAKSDPRIAVDPGLLDARPWLLNCENGTLDLRTYELRPHDPADLLTRIVAAPYLPDAAAPRWDAFLNQVQPTADTRAYLQRVCGMALTGTNPERVMFVFHGDGRNGKTVVAETMQLLLADYAGPINKDALVERRAGQVRNDLADARGKRLVISSETEEGEKLSVAEVKAITGGDSISVRRLYENAFSFRPEFKVWLLTNYLPRVTDPGVATWDRLRVIPFGVRVADQDVVPLEEMLAAFRQEAAGILAWAVKGCADWRRIGLAEPLDVVLAGAAWRESEDVVGSFINDTTTDDPDGFLTSHELYKAYCVWCVENGHRPMSLKRLSPTLQKRGFTSCRENAKGRRKGYCGRTFTDEGVRLSTMQEMGR